jgi:hypothetical protein
MWHAQIRKMHGVFWLENLKETDHMEDLAVDGRTVIKWILKV